MIGGTDFIFEGRCQGDVKFLCTLFDNIWPDNMTVEESTDTVFVHKNKSVLDLCDLEGVTDYVGERLICVYFSDDGINLVAHHQGESNKVAQYLVRMLANHCNLKADL